MCLFEWRKKDIEVLSYRDIAGNLSKNITRYGTTIDRVYPLLNPEFNSNNVRLKKHANWFRDFTKAKKFLTEGGAENEEHA